MGRTDTNNRIYRLLASVLQSVGSLAIPRRLVERRYLEIVIFSLILVQG